MTGLYILSGQEAKNEVVQESVKEIIGQGGGQFWQKKNSFWKLVSFKWLTFFVSYFYFQKPLMKTKMEWSPRKSFARMQPRAAPSRACWGRRVRLPRPNKPWILRFGRSRHRMWKHHHRKWKPHCRHVDGFPFASSWEAGQRPYQSSLAPEAHW